MARLVWLLTLGLLVACAQPESRPEAGGGGASGEQQAQPPTPLSNSAGMANLTIANDTQRQLVLLYASPSGDEVWGEDLLEGNVVIPGEVVTFVLPPGWWDVKCVLEDEDQVLFAELELEADDYVLSLMPEEGEGEQAPEDGARPPGE